MSDKREELRKLLDGTAWSEKNLLDLLIRVHNGAVEACAAEAEDRRGDLCGSIRKLKVTP